MSWKGIVKVTFPSQLQTLMALFPKSKVLKGLVSRSEVRVDAFELHVNDGLCAIYDYSLNFGNLAHKQN